MSVLCLPSSSSSSSRRTWKYEVFLSFRGEDTRNSFTGHLYAALQRKGICTFKDDKKLQRGECIRSELIEAIEESQISIVVLSKNYADSAWCLDELAKICEGINEPGYTVLPIFYDVDPSDVRNQRGDFKEAFDKHEQHSSDKLPRWKSALEKVANLAGYDVRNKSESDIVEEIVRDVTHRLKHKFSSLADDLVGMQSRAEAIEKLLHLDSSDDVQFVGILGMPGVGKTTLAAVVYDRISHHFDACCLLLDTSKVHKGPGLVRLQQQLLYETGGKDQEVWEEYTGSNLIRTRLCKYKTLIVVDNVDHADQLEKLVGKPESGWFGPGSRIIITTRDEYILRSYRVDKVYKVELLNDEEALQLLCRRAFKSDDPDDEFQELSHRLLQYAKALPLAIKVLGSSLLMRKQSEWESQLNRLQENPNQEIMGVLETSLFTLERRDKDIFVDVACFFKGEDEKYARKILDHCYCQWNNPDELGINILCERSLIVIVNGTIWMHDLLQEVGWKIAKGEFPQEPAKWSRIWLYKDLQAVKTGTEKVEAIVLKEEDVDVNEMLPLRAEALSQMTHLRLIIFPSMKFSGKLNNLSDDLRFLSWQKFPFNYLPSSFEPAKLVELIMIDSNIRLLWEGVKVLPELKIIDLHGSKNLIKTPNLKGVKNLEKLDLEGCSGLLEVDASIGDLRKLTFLNLRHCDRLISVPNALFLSTSLETLNLPGCLILAQRLNFQGPP